MYDIVSMGELLIDFTESGHSPSGMRLFEQNPGGAVTNLLAAAARCGAKAAFMGKVGEDMHGHFLCEAMEKAGVDMSRLLFDASVFTTLAFVALGENGERSFSFARKPGADTCICTEELDAALLQNTRIFHTGSLSLTDEPARSATYEAIRLAKAAGAVISYDPNYRASLWPNEAAAIERMRSLIATADMMKLSDEECVLLTGEKEPEAAARKLHAMGVQVVAVTLGSEGALLLAQGESRHVPGYKAKAVDTTGAGDAFFGGFLYRYLQLAKTPAALTIDEAADCARFGNATASLCVEGRGGIPSMPTREAVEKRMEEGVN